ncbi:MAG: MurR/RpiR family transcriptional regulator [Ruminococcaceae bacterium]|nr:MurR/RpiR family transcriptional regulator [Oscillospiraceae bacterium]
MTDILTKIETMMPEFSKGQKAIGRYMLEHYDKAAYLTASKLGAVVRVSESTVVRFAIELGFEGYPELQKSLQELIRTKLTSVQRMEITNDRIGDGEVLSKILAGDIEKIRTTLDRIDQSAFDAAVDAIIGAKHIYISGMRSASLLSGFLGYYFNLMFPDVRTVQATSSSEMFEQLFRIEGGDVFIGISFPRYSKRIIDAIDFAKSKGAVTVALTDSETSPLAAGADHLLIARSDMASFVDSYVAPLSVINALIVAVSKKKQQDVSETFEKLEAIWDEYDVYAKNGKR